jgi:hypothetical protein
MNTIESINQALAIRTLVSQFQLDVEPTTGRYDLIVVMVETEELTNPVTLRFSDIAELKLDISVGGWVQFVMLRLVRSPDANRERGIEVRDQEHGAIHFICRACTSA